MRPVMKLSTNLLCIRNQINGVLLVHVSFDFSVAYMSKKTYSPICCSMFKTKAWNEMENKVSYEAYLLIVIFNRRVSDCCLMPRETF